jgi:hypothetical protein
MLPFVIDDDNLAVNAAVGRCACWKSEPDNETPLTGDRRKA